MPVSNMASSQRKRTKPECLYSTGYRGKDAKKMKVIRDNNKTSRDIKKAYETKKYIVTWKSVYQPFYSINAGYYAQEVYCETNGNMTRAGRFFHMTGEAVNKLIGIQHLRNL